MLALIQDSFASMDDRIDPPSSMYQLTTATLSDMARDGEIWRIDAGGEPVACVILSRKPDALYLGKLAVLVRYRGQGLARQLVELAKTRARAQGLARVRLNTRVELVENHLAFVRMGFRKVGEVAHPGFSRPTSVTMECEVGP